MTKCKSSLTAVGAGVLLAASLFAALPAQAASTESVSLLVAYRPGAAAALRAAVAKFGGHVDEDLSMVSALAITLPKSRLDALKAHSSVDLVEEDRLVQMYGATPKRGAAAAVAADSPPQTVPYGISMVQADQITGTGSWTPTVCIIDSGIDATHEDLSGNNMAGKNFSDGGDWNTDTVAHGTHVSGTIAALDNTIGVVGVNGKKQVNLYMAKVFGLEGSASTKVIIKALNACLQIGANVVSMSLGSSVPSVVEGRMVNKLWASGALVVAAAGNAGTTAKSWPAAYENVMSVAAVDSNMAWATFSQYNYDVAIAGPGVNVLSTVPPGTQLGASATVGGSSYDVLGMAGSPLTSATGPLADFGLGTTPVAGSMTGMVCLISRGSIAFADKVLNCQNSGGIGAIIYNNTTGPLNGTLGTTVTTIPSVGALQTDGATMLTQVGQSSTVSVFVSDAAYAYFSGTSMATPHVSGVAGLVWSFHPECTNAEMRMTLRKSALDIGDPGYDPKTGSGLVQAKAALDHIDSMGCGN